MSIELKRISGFVDHTGLFGNIPDLAPCFVIKTRYFDIPFCSWWSLDCLDNNLLVMFEMDNGYGGIYVVTDEIDGDERYLAHLGRPTITIKYNMTTYRITMYKLEWFIEGRNCIHYNIQEDIDVQLKNRVLRKVIKNKVKEIVDIHTNYQKEN